MNIIEARHQMKNVLVNFKGLLQGFKKMQRNQVQSLLNDIPEAQRNEIWFWMSENYGNQVKLHWD